MSEEESDSSSPDRDVKSETLSNPNSRSMDNNEDQTENNSNPRETPNIPDKNKDNFRNENEMLNQNGLSENDDKYIDMIEGYEDELYIEKYITKSLKKDANFNEEVNKLKLDLTNKNNKLEQLKSINKKQETTLNEFRNKLKKENNKKSMNNKVIINDENNNSNIREVSKNEVINNAIKNKDSDLMNVLNKMNLLKKENEELKKKIYQNEMTFNCSHNSNSNYEDSFLKNLEKIKFLQTEKRLLDKQLLEHNKCIEEQNLINKEYNNLKNELKILKINNQEIKGKIKEFEKKILNLEINDINTTNIQKNNINSLTMKKKNYIYFSNKRTSSIKNSIFSKTLPKVQNKSILPIISIQPLVPNISNYSNESHAYKSILSEDFLKKIKKYFNNNETEYLNLVEKINNIENTNNISGDSNLVKLKKYTTHIGILDKINLLNFDGKEKEGDIKVTNNKLNFLKDENIQQNKKIEELQKHLDNIKNLEKEKEKEINILLNKINSMKNNLKIYNK